MKKNKPMILITGNSGLLGKQLTSALMDRFHVVGMDRCIGDAVCDEIEIDLTSDESVATAFDTLRAEHGDQIAAVLHLAAYYDFSGEPHPLYQKLNVDGTRRLLQALSAFHVERFVYPGTMLVHEPGQPGLPLDESAAISPAWAYPESKAGAEAAIAKYRGAIPATVLRLAGVYSDDGGVPTLTHQIQRIYERSLKSHVYAGDTEYGQSMVHIEDVVDAFERTVERRATLPEYCPILIGEPEPMSYQALQNAIGKHLHGDATRTISVPEPVAKAGAWIENRLEPVVPDAIDQGEQPFIKPFMVDLAEDHYELDISRARELLDWEPSHRLADTLPSICAALLKDPLGWYEKNGLTAPRWLEQLDEAADGDTEALRKQYEAHYIAEHQGSRWAHFVNMGLGAWLVAAPITHDYAQLSTSISTVAAGALVVVLGGLSLSWRLPAVRWLQALVGIYLMAAPLVFWASDAVAYADGTLIGALVTGLAVAVRPAPGVAPVATLSGPTVPPGWSFCPSSWTQRMPIILLAFVGLFISRYLTAYQLGHIDTVWEPFFNGSTPERNGTEQVITSEVSRAWPVPDAGIGALTYMLEIVTGLIGSSKRWRTMPWLVMLFGIMIIPLGAVSIFFIIIQPIVIGTWCTLCLIAAAAMLLQIPYSFDELVATTEFLWRRHRAGRSLLRVFFLGDTDDEQDRDVGRESPEEIARELEQRPIGVIRNAFAGGVNLPWNLVFCIAIGVFLMFSRLAYDSTPPMAHGEHLIGALVVTIAVTTLAEVARPLRFIIGLLGAALIGAPFLLEGAALSSIVIDMVAGAALIALCIPRGKVRNRYGLATRYLI